MGQVTEAYAFSNGLQTFEDNGDGTGARNVVATGKSASIQVIPVLTNYAAPYASGDAVGGKLTIQNASRVAAKPTILQSIFILDRGNQKCPFEIVIYNADPTAAAITDNSAFASNADDAKEIARITVAASDYVTLNSKARANIRSIGEILVPASGVNLYAALVSNGGTPTYLSASDLIFRFKFLQD